MALAPLSAGACRTGFVILTAQPMAGHGAKGERRELRPGRSSCRTRLDLDPGRRQALALDHRPARTPADGHAGERRGRADRHCALVNGCPRAGYLRMCTSRATGANAPDIGRPRVPG
jgi:hypothetical protein